MNREHYKKQTEEILCGNDNFGWYHQANLQKYNLSEMTPIESETLPQMPKGKIVLTETVYQHLKAIEEVTVAEKKEFPFWLFGSEVDSNIVVFDEFFSQSKQRKTTEVSFSKEMLEYLQKKIQADNFIVCWGHSHPPVVENVSNFSFGDLISYLQMKTNNKVFKNKNIDLIGGLVSPSDGLAFIYGDGQEFYRFPDILIKNKEGQLQEIAEYQSSLKKRKL